MDAENYPGDACDDRPLELGNHGGRRGAFQHLASRAGHQKAFVHESEAADRAGGLIADWVAPVRGGQKSTSPSSRRILSAGGNVQTRVGHDVQKRVVREGDAFDELRHVGERAARNLVSGWVRMGEPTWDI
jgi:hypothetical protein